MKRDDSGQRPHGLSKTRAWEDSAPTFGSYSPNRSAHQSQLAQTTRIKVSQSDQQLNQLLALESTQELHAKVESKELIDGRYRLRSLIGEGGCGVIYQAEDLKLSNRSVALKLLNFDMVRDEKMSSLFQRERKILSRISHPSILALYDSGTTSSGQPYFVTELLHGCDLSEHLSSQPKLGLQEATQLVIEVAEALTEAHALGVIHRDIKPANIYLHYGPSGSREHYQVKVLDFGISKIKHGMLQTIASHHQTSGIILGTPKYMSPEQHLNFGGVDHRTDIYALGILYYLLITGEVPFSGDDYIEVASLHIKAPMPSVAGHVEPYLVDYIDLIIGKLTAKKPEDRLQTMEQVSQELGQLLPHLSSGAPLPSQLSPHARIDQVATMNLSQAGRSLTLHEAAPPSDLTPKKGFMPTERLNRGDELITKRLWLTLCVVVFTVSALVSMCQGR